MSNKVQIVNYFVYKGINYSNGTEIILVDKIYLQYNLNPPNNYNVIFKERNIANEEMLCLIKGVGCIMIPNNQCVKGIVKPIYYNKPLAIESALNNYTTRKKTPDVFHGWLWYIFIMLFLLICKNGFLYMIIATVFFASWLISKYKD